jgi:hypothetical protein
MTYHPRTLSRIIQDINQSLYLPHIQRPFVWSGDQMCRLFDSLMRNYPIQTFLFWRTKDEIKARRFMDVLEWDANLSDLYDKAKSSPGVEKVFVLDGQQRLQTLYTLYNGSVDSTAGAPPRDAYLDVTGGKDLSEEGLLHQLRFSSDPLPLPMYRLRNLLTVHEKRNNEEIAEDLNEQISLLAPDEESAIRNARERRVRRNISQLVSILREEKHFWVEELDGVAEEYPYKRVLDIFVRVNSGGTKLDAADLMFAAMKEGWDEIEEKIEDAVGMLNNNRLSFDKSVVLKCIMVSLGEGAELDPDKFVSSKDPDKDGNKTKPLAQRIEEDWSRIEGTLNQLRDFITNDLQLYGDKVVRTYNSFVPIFDYLYYNRNPQPGDYRLIAGYYYKSQLFNWYARQTDGVLNAVHSIVGRVCSDGFPLAELKAYFGGSRGYAVELQPEHLQDIRLRFIILNLIYVQQFGISPFNVAFKGNEPQIDHIYPQSQLRRSLGLTTDEINHIGNYRYVGAMENLRKRAELPTSYFARLQAGDVPIQKHLLLSDFSTDPSKLVFDIDTYRRFRDSRLDAVFDIACKVVNPELD